MVIPIAHGNHCDNAGADAGEKALAPAYFHQVFGVPPQLKV